VFKVNKNPYSMIDITLSRYKNYSYLIIETKNVIVPILSTVMIDSPQDMTLLNESGKRIFSQQYSRSSPLLYLQEYGRFKCINDILSFNNTFSFQ